MIWLPNEEERKIYQAVGVMTKDFNEFDKTNLLKKIKLMIKNIYLYLNGQKM